MIKSYGLRQRKLRRSGHHIATVRLPRTYFTNGPDEDRNRTAVNRGFQIAPIIPLRRRSR